MSSPLPPDPYLTLGVPKDATAAVIKTQYRKLALKFHPDKVPDEAQKQAAADQFHKIQTAYEIVGDEDRRARYDAQCKLAQLKKEAMERGGRGPVEVRTAAYKMPTETPKAAAFYTRGPERVEKVSPVYEERRPNYATDYFDSQPPRATTRKEPEYERSSSRRTSPRDDRESVKAQTRETKENDRVRQSEKTRRREKERGKDRDRKTTFVEEEISSEDDYERQSRRMREEDAESRRGKAYYSESRRQKDDASQSYYDGADRARKVTSQFDAAMEHIGSRSKRPSPERAASSKHKVEYIKRSDGRPPVMVRRGSGRPEIVSRDSEYRRSSARESERRTSLDAVQESQRQPPPLQHSKSSPPEIRPNLERQRSSSVQIERDDGSDFVPKMRRAETMPHVFSQSSHRKDSSAPLRGSSLRQTEIVDGQPTPVETPVEFSAPRYRYHTEYADDNEYATPDGYRTEIREPARETAASSRPRYTRSPSPMSASRVEKPRTASSRFVSSQRPQAARTTSTSYVYGGSGQGVEAVRPSNNRENSSRDRLYYGEIPTTARSPKPASSSRYSPPAESVRYAKEIRPEDIKVQSGYEYSSRGRRPSTASRPSYSRSGSQSVYVR